jgi:Arc/MetJ-type ribon-helix-helix transcriptional regulator
MEKCVSFEDYEKNFEVMVSFRLTPAQVEAIKRVVRNNGDVYDNVSHFFRVGALRLLRTHILGGKKDGCDTIRRK